MVGLDTVYVRGLEDDEVLRRTRAEGRVLLTRDRALARQEEGSVLLVSSLIDDQWRELVARFPTLPREPKYERCTLCNGHLDPYRSGPGEPLPDGVPSGLRRTRSGLFRCQVCGHFYWPGSHTAAVRRRLEQWSQGPHP
jgi:uncharacterized protein with PIN domain